jgi:hypothetical protein
LTLTVIALPVEILLVTLSGNGYDHYFLALLPVFAVLAAFTFRILLGALERAGVAQWVRVAFVATLVGLLVILSAENVRTIFLRIATRENRLLIDYILATTDAQDRVLIWAGEIRLNFMAKRESPIRYLHGGPLRSTRPGSKSRLRQVMTDLEEDRPRWIIGEPGALPLFSQFSAAEPEVAAASRAFLRNYKLRESVDQWTIYELQTP